MVDNEDDAASWPLCPLCDSSIRPTDSVISDNGLSVHAWCLDPIEGVADTPSG